MIDTILAQAQTTDITWIERGGIIAVLVMALYFVTRAFIRGQIHSDSEYRTMDDNWQSRYDEMKDDRDFWRQTAIRGTSAAESATILAERIAAGNPEVRY